MRLINKIICSSLLLSSNYIFADDFNNRFYVSGNYGRHFGHKFSEKFYPETKKTKGNIYGLGLGYYIDENFRVDLNFQKFDILKYNFILNEFRDASQTFTRVYYNQKISLNSYLVNLYYQLNSSTDLKPYISMSLGIARNKPSGVNSHITYSFDEINYNTYASDLSKAKTKYNFAYGIGGGLSYELNNRITLDLINYKFYNLGRAVTSNTLNIEDGNNSTLTKLKVHTIFTGFRINF